MRTGLLVSSSSNDSNNCINGKVVVKRIMETVGKMVLIVRIGNI